MQFPGSLRDSDCRDVWGWMCGASVGVTFKGAGSRPVRIYKEMVSDKGWTVILPREDLTEQGGLLTAW